MPFDLVKFYHKSRLTDWLSIKLHLHIVDSLFELSYYTLSSIWGGHGHRTIISVFTLQSRSDSKISSDFMLGRFVLFPVFSCQCVSQKIFLNSNQKKLFNKELGVQNSDMGGSSCKQKHQMKWNYKLKSESISNLSVSWCC